MYRDLDGRLHVRSALCPHLGGVVGWNEVETTWDCPCHGSRFDAYGRVVQGPANSDLGAKKLVEEICRELEVHTTLEEEIFHPAVREAIDDDDLMDEATVEHQSAEQMRARKEDLNTGTIEKVKRMLR